MITAILMETGSELDFAAVEQSYRAVPTAFELAVQESEARLHEIAADSVSDQLGAFLPSFPPVPIRVRATVLPCAISWKCSGSMRRGGRKRE